MLCMDGYLFDLFDLFFSFFIHFYLFIYFLCSFMFKEILFFLCSK